MIKSICLFVISALLLTAPLFALDTEKLYRIGVDINYPPFSYMDEKSGQLSGFDVDIASAVCKNIGIKCEVVGMIFDELIPAVQRGGLDVVCAGLGYTAERAKTLLFTDRYYRSNSIFVQHDLDLVEVSSATISGKTVAVQKGTIQLEFLEKRYRGIVTAVPRNTMAEVMDAVKGGKADLGFVDGVAAYAYLRSEDGRQLDIAGDPVTLEVDDSLMAVNISQPELRDSINKAIAAIRHSGEYDVISLKYFDYSIY